MDEMIKEAIARGTYPLVVAQTLAEASSVAMVVVPMDPKSQLAAKQMDEVNRHIQKNKKLVSVTYLQDKTGWMAVYLLVEMPADGD